MIVAAAVGRAFASQKLKSTFPITLIGKRLGRNVKMVADPIYL